MKLPVVPGKITQLWADRQMVEDCFHDLRSQDLPGFTLFLVVDKGPAKDIVHPVWTHLKGDPEDLLVLLHLGVPDYSGWSNVLPFLRQRLYQKRIAMLALFEESKEGVGPLSKAWAFSAHIRGELSLSPRGWHARLTKDKRVLPCP